MKDHTYFKIGGPADVLVEPKSMDAVQSVINYCKDEEVPYMVIGNGTNLLVSDKGIRGVVIKIADGFKGYSVDGMTMTAYAGNLLSTLSKVAMEHGQGCYLFRRRRSNCNRV